MKTETGNRKLETACCLLLMAMVALALLMVSPAQARRVWGTRAGVNPTPAPAVRLDAGSRSPIVETIHIGVGAGDAAVITPVEGVATTVFITGDVRDPDGCGDLAAEGISGVLYRTNVAGGAGCSADGNNCYQIPAESCRITGCDNLRFSTVQYACEVPVWYYAETTVLGPHEPTDWTARVVIRDAHGREGAGSKQVEVGAVVGLAVTPSIDYGTLALGSVSEAQPLVVQNTGNVDLDVLLNAPEAMKCSRGEIPLGETHASLKIDTGYARALPVGISQLKVDLKLPPQRGEAASETPIYLRLKLPDYGVGGTCKNTIVSTAIRDE